MPNINCPHMVVRAWEEERPSEMKVGAFLPAPVPIRWGGWKCTICGEPFVPKYMVKEEMLAEMRRKHGELDL